MTDPKFSSEVRSLRDMELDLEQADVVAQGTDPLKNQKVEERKISVKNEFDQWLQQSGK